jgi:hypothetical protein
MSPSNVSGLPCKVHLDIKNKMAFYPFVTWWNSFIFIEELEGGPDISHLLLYCIVPESCLCFLIDLQGFTHRCRDLNPKFMSLPCISCLSGLNETLPMIQGRLYPPTEGFFILKIIVNGILCQLYRERSLCVN